MGMSSSQARLLTLTARMHDIEYKAQRIEAQKLQMANESRRAYEDYLNALDAKKIQYKSINNDGSITFRDATLNTLENGAIPGYEGEASHKPFLLKNGFNDEIYVTPQFAEAFGIVDNGELHLGDLDSYLEEHGLTRTVPIYRTDYETDYNTIVSVNPTQNVVTPPKPATTGTSGYWKPIRVHPAVFPNNQKYSLYENLSAPILTSVTEQKENCINQSQSTFIENTFVYDGSATKPVQYSLNGIAENLYILEALANGYNEDEYASMADGKIDNNKILINNLFNKDSDELYINMQNLQRFSGLLEHILKNGSIEDIKNAYNIISNGNDDALAINESLLALASGYDTSSEATIPDTIDVDGISNHLEIRHPDLKFNGTYETTVPKLDCTNFSKKDVMAIVAQTMLDNGKWQGETLDSLLDSSDKLNPIKNLTKLQYAQIANILVNGDAESLNAFLNGLEAGNLVLGEVPAEWNGITENNIEFNTYNQILINNGYSTSSYQYYCSREDIANIIAYNLLTKNNVEGPDQTLTEELLTSLSAAMPDDSQWVSLMTYYNTTDWSTILSIIESGNLSELADYTDDTPEGMTATLKPTSGGYYNLEWVEGDPPTEAQPGTVTIPKIEVLASNMLAAFRKNGIDIPEEKEQQVTNKIISSLTSFYANTVYSSDMLAEINDAVCEYLITGANAGAISILYDNIKNNNGLVAGLAQEDHPNQIIFFEYMLTGNYNFVFDNNAQPCSVTYAQIPIQVDTGERTWDTSDSRYKELSEEYYMLKSLENCLFKIIDEDLCNSAEFVSNWLTLNEGYLLEFDPKTQEMVDTNVAVTTHLQEVSDEKDLKKAEAKYEADMKRIDMKDRRYDTQLAALDNERNAVKQEMETVKTVAKDNVDRTFRLFS